MMRVKITQIREGLHPSEVVISVNGVEGTERLIVSRRSVSDDTIAVGYPIKNDGENYLVELPRETTTGAWRIWVSKDKLVPEKEGVAA